MKLAEALSIRKDLQKRIQQLGQRIQNNVKVQEGDAPSEEPMVVTLWVENDKKVSFMVVCIVFMCIFALNMTPLASR
jgi:hypothetical protein